MSIGCINSEREANKTVIPKVHENQNAAKNTESIDGENYSDSMINVLIAERNISEIPIDTFRVLHEIKCNQKTTFGGHTFSTKSIKSYQPYQTEITSQLKQILGVTECICNFKSSDNFDTFIFYSDQLESHSSTPISIISINKNSNSYHALALVKEYGSEQGSYVISSKFLSESTIERNVNHNINFIHGIGTVDSIYLEKEIYNITESGNFELTSSTIEPSSVRNNIFEN